MGHLCRVRTDVVFRFPFAWRARCIVPFNGQVTLMMNRADSNAYRPLNDSRRVRDSIVG
jgi:hypothetical protein